MSSTSDNKGKKGGKKTDSKDKEDRDDKERTEDREQEQPAVKEMSMDKAEGKGSSLDSNGGGLDDRSDESAEVVKYDRRE